MNLVERLEQAENTFNSLKAQYDDKVAASKQADQDATGILVEMNRVQGDHRTIQSLINDEDLMVGVKIKDEPALQPKSKKEK